MAVEQLLVDQLKQKLFMTFSICHPENKVGLASNIHPTRFKKKAFWIFLSNRQPCNMEEKHRPMEFHVRNIQDSQPKHKSEQLCFQKKIKNLTDH